VNLVESAALLKGNLVDLEKLQKSAGAADRFERRAKDLVPSAKELLQLAKTVSVLHKNSVPMTALQQVNAAPLEALLKRLSDNYENDPTTILDPFPSEDVRARLLTPLRQLPGALRSVLGNLWAAWVTGKLPSMNDEVLRVLATITALSHSVEKLQTLKREVLTAAAVLPQEQADIDGVLNRVKTIEKEWASLAGAGIPDDVIRFLRLAGQTGGAPYGMLTAPVMQWLKEHEIHHLLKIKIG